MSGGSRVPPPSFSSFPQAEPPKTTSKRAPPPPPSFASFPTDSRTSLTSSGDKKRPRAQDFLDEVGAEIGIVDAKKDRKSSSSRHDDFNDEERRRRSKGKDRERQEESKSGKEKSRSHREDGRDREHRHSSRKEHRSERSREEKGKGRERSRRDDEPTKGSKSYQVVQSSASTPVPEDSPFSAPAVIEERRDKPLFYESRKGDDLNVVYGGLHRGDVPRYYRQAAGRVLGLNSGLRITKETAYTGRGVEIAPLNRYRTPRYIDPSSARYVNDKTTKRLALLPRRQTHPQILGESPGPPPPPLEDDVEPPYISLLPERSRSDRVVDLEHEDGTEYRSIAGPVKESQLDSDSGEGEDDHDTFGDLGISGGESQDEYLKRRNLELDRSLRDDPRNVQGWLEFVEFQDEVAQRSFVGSSLSSKRALSHNERTSTAEIKLAILTRALATEGNERSEPLLLAFLKAAAQVEDPKKVLKRWKDTLNEHPDLTGLWIEYVSWRQTSWVTFSVKDVVEVFEECLDVLMLAMLRKDIGTTALEVIEGNGIYLFLRLCLMLRQAGYSERAFAAFQGLIELNLFRPTRLDLPSPDAPRRKWTDKVVDELEEFWDDEVPRIGDKGAKGWSCTTDDDTPSYSNGLEAYVAPAPADGARPFETWAIAERTASLDAALPSRTAELTLDESDDPFRVVLFDDIRPFLFVVHSSDSKLQLAYAFLTFLGLPFVPPDFPTSTPFTTDSFIHSELVERPRLVERFWPPIAGSQKPFEMIGGEAMEPERRSALGTPFEIPFLATPSVVDQLFPAKAKGEWFATIRKEDLEDVQLEQARNVLSLLKTVSQDQFLTLDLFAFEAALGPKGAVKAAKQILRDQRQDLVLWDGYARIERQRGKIADARQVYCTALSMYRSFKPQEQIDGPLLWRSWAEMEWEEGNSTTCLKVLLAAAVTEGRSDLASLSQSPEKRPAPTEILQARQYYTTQLEASFQQQATQSVLRNRNHFAFSAALLGLLTQGLDAAVEILEQQLFRLECVNAAGSAEHEELYMLYSKLLYRQSMKGAYKPAQLRDLLERAIKEYKNNTLFLGLFYHNELRMKIQNRIRKTLEEQVLTEKSVTSNGFLFAIFAELHLDMRSQNLWAVRNLFDRAVENPNTKSSPSIWTLYIDFEVRNGELKRAKALIYRALRECPWCREFYLRPFSPALRSVYRSSELRDFHHLLLEKGLRIRVDLEPFLENAVLSDAEMSEDDVAELAPGELEVGEEVFTERKKLMPY